MAKKTSKKVAEEWVLMTELNGEPLLHHFKLSNYGNVVRIKKGQGAEEIFEPRTIGGYKYISFTTRKKNQETIYVHRLVAQFFLPPPLINDEFVIHKDYVRVNNHVDNLMWVDRKGLAEHRGKRAGRSPGRSNSRKKLDEVLVESEARKQVEFNRDLSDLMGISQ